MLWPRSRLVYVHRPDRHGTRPRVSAGALALRMINRDREDVMSGSCALGILRTRPHIYFAQQELSDISQAQVEKL